MSVYRGVGVALVTIFHDDGAIDLDSTAKLARELVERGMQAVLVAGSTGEASTLADPERRALVQAVRKTVPDETPVIAGTGAPSIRQAVALTRDAVGAGADAVLAWPPPGSRDLPGYYSAVAGAAAGRPVLAYHFPAVSAPGVPVTALGNLPVTGVKDSSGDPSRLLDELAHYTGDTYVGSSALLALAGPMGATGALLALANAEPERCVVAFAGDAVTQRDLAERHLEVAAAPPVVLKRLLARSHGLPATCRIG
jgi:4-hydroxy-tetrahydrodipicolinate synthase